MSDMLKEFDPTDADGAMQLAYAALSLAKVAQRAAETEGQVGRDLRRDLSVAVMNVAQRLRLLSSQPSGADINLLFDYWRQS